MKAPSIPRKRVMDFVRELGFDPCQVADMQCNGRDLTITTYHLHPEHGGRHTEPDTNGVMAVIHRLRLTDEEGDT